MLVAVLHFLQEEDEPETVLSTLLDALPSGSYLAASHVTMEHDPVGVGGGQRAYREAGLPMRTRDADEFAQSRSPALTSCRLVWCSSRNGGRTRTAPRPTPAAVSIYGGVTRKPVVLS